MRTFLQRFAQGWRAWVKLLSRTEPAIGWALFRIGIGLCLLYSLVSVAAVGLLDFFWLDLEYGGYRELGPVKVLMLELGPASPALVHGVYTVALSGTLAMTIGIGGRFATFAAMQGFLALSTLNTQCIGSDEGMLSNALWLLFLCDGSSTLSLRSKLRCDRWVADTQVNAWARYLAVFQLLVVYTFAGLNKTNSSWVPGGDMDGMYLALLDSTWRRFDMDWLAYVYPLTQLLSVLTWLFETFAWLMLLIFYYRYTREQPGGVRAAFNHWDLRKPFAVTGASLHLGIFVFMDVGPFSFVALSYYLCLFQPEELTRLAGALRSWVMSAAPARGSADESRRLAGTRS